MTQGSDSPRIIPLNPQVGPMKWIPSHPHEARELSLREVLRLSRSYPASKWWGQTTARSGRSDVMSVHSPAPRHAEEGRGRLCKGLPGRALFS